MMYSGCQLALEGDGSGMWDGPSSRFSCVGVSYVFWEGVPREACLTYSFTLQELGVYICPDLRPRGERERWGCTV
jgi:hypothetical protein